MILSFGLMWVYIIFNIFGALVLYWLVRVPKKAKAEKETAPIVKTATNDSKGVDGVAPFRAASKTEELPTLEKRSEPQYESIVSDSIGKAEKA